MKTVVVAAPCKINLSLDITGVRRDGYHELRSVMQTVDLYDYLLIGESEYAGIFVECDREQLICDTTNTAYRAAEAFMRRAGIARYAVRIEIIKNIPMQAGLGGGSSDAAAALVGLNRLYGTPFSMAELCAIGAGIGADVPFCLRGGTALCEGTGDVFTDLPPLPDCPIVIARPEQGVSTVNSFARYDRRGGGMRPDTDALVQAVRAGSLPGVAAQMRNVLEAVCDVAQVEEFKRVFCECGALGSVMTGSGSAVIGIFLEKRAARRAHRKLLSRAAGVFVAHPVPFGARVAEGARGAAAL